MRTIKSILREYNKKYNFNYDKNLSRNQIGFFIENSDVQDLEDKKENVDKRNLDTDLDFIDIKLLVNDYKSEIIDKCLDGMINYNESETEDTNFLNFKNFIVKKRYEIIKQKIEEEKNMFIQYRNKRYGLLSNREKIRRLFKDGKIEKNIKEYKNKKDSFNRNDVMERGETAWNSYKYTGEDRLEFINNYLNKKIFDNNDIEKILLSYLDVRENKCLDEGKQKEIFCVKIIKDKLNNYTEFIKQKDKEQKLNEKFELLKSEYDKTLKLRENFLNNQSNDFLNRYENEGIAIFYEERMNEINQKLDEIDGKLKQQEKPTIKVENNEERQAVIGEIKNKSKKLRFLREQTANLEKQENKDDKNSAGWIRIE